MGRNSFQVELTTKETIYEYMPYFIDKPEKLEWLKDYIYIHKKKHTINNIKEITKINDDIVILFHEDEKYYNLKSFLKATIYNHYLKRITYHDF